MGNAGRPRVPDEIKKARGTDRKDRTDPGIPKREGDKLPNCPARLKGSSKWFWKHWARRLWDENWLSVQSTQGFILLCETYGLYDTMRMYCNKWGYVYTVVTKSGAVDRPRPEYLVMHQQELLMKALYTDFGFDSLGQRRSAPTKKGERPKASAKEKQDIRKFVGG